MPADLRNAATRSAAYGSATRTGTHLARCTEPTGIAADHVSHGGRKPGNQITPVPGAMTTTSDVVRNSTHMSAFSCVLRYINRIGRQKQFHVGRDFEPVADHPGKLAHELCHVSRAAFMQGFGNDQGV